MTQPARTMVSPGTGWARLARFPSFPQVDPELDPAGGQGEARRRDEARSGDRSLSECRVWFDGLQVAERVADDLAQVFLRPGPLAGGVCRRRPRRPTARLPRGPAGQRARRGHARWLPEQAPGIPAPDAAGPARPRASCGRSSGRLADSGLIRFLRTTSPQGASGGTWLRSPDRCPRSAPGKGTVARQQLKGEAP